MALTAKFTADFSQFESAIKGAAVTVTTFEKGVKNAAADLSKLASSLSGAEIQRQATLAANAIESIGGATKLTAAEAAKMAGPIDQAIAKYKALGQQVPPELEKISKELQDVQKNAQKAGDSAGGIGGKFKSELAGIGPAIVGAFSVGAIIGFGKELLDLGAQIADTSKKLGISTDAVQELQYAAEQTGTTLDTFAGGMVKLQDKLQEGSKGTLEAFERLNLSIEDVKRQHVDQAFTSVAEAIGSVEDPMEQTQLAMELFGKAGVEALPAIREGMANIRDEAKKLGAVMSEENVKALDEFDQRLENTFKQIQIGATKSIGYIGDLFNIMTSLPWNAIAESITVPDLPPAKPLEVDTGARARAMAELAEGTKRANAVLDDHVAVTKQATDAAKAHAKAIEALRDHFSGAALQAEITRTAEAWEGLTRTQKESDAALKRILPTLENYVREGGKLPPVLQKIYDEHKRATTAVADLTGGLSKALPILGDYATKLNAPVDALKSLRLDGLLPAIPLTERFGVVLEAAGNKSKDIAGDFKKAADAAAEFKRQGEALASSQWAAETVDAVAAALASGGGLPAVVQGVGDVALGAFRQQAEKQIGEAVAAGLGVAAATVASAGVAAIVAIGAYAISQLVASMGEEERKREAKELGAALGSEFMSGFGSAEKFLETAIRAGVSTPSISKIISPQQFELEDVQQAIAEATPALNQFRQELEGVGKAAQGVNRFAAALGAQFAPGFRDQANALKESQAAMLEYERAGGASAERLAALQKTFAEDASKQVFTLTAENIDRVNSLGLFIGATIANTVGRTGDLVGAIQAVGPALAGLDELRDKADLGDQLTPATQQVLSLYDTVSNNEDAFNAISGITQMMDGFGQAMISNTPLANAFGGELAAQFTILKDRGVEIPTILASMQAPLQELWELSKEGKITVDDTTQALLNQAEAQGIVGADMMDTNKQLLAVLTELKDLFASALPGAIDQTAQSGRRLNKELGPETENASRGGTSSVVDGQRTQQAALFGTQQKADELGTALGPRLGFAARTGQLAVLDATEKEKQALLMAQAEAERLNRTIGPGMVTAASTANAAIDTLSRRSITIPIHFDMDEPPPMPDYPAPEPPTQPGDAGTANSYSQQSTGHTEVNFNVDGNTLARIVAPRIPGVVNGYVVD